jgi:hypothetical protein
MLGIAMRIAQRMGINNESELAKCTVLEAEMRRRLWWSLLLFDTRISEMADYKSTMLVPTWDCRIPLNVNDSDIRSEMKEPPVVQGKSSEALFAVVRSELGEFIRHTMFHLEFTCPALKPIAKDFQRGPNSEGSELVNLEKLIEDKYLRFCDPENPLHYMTIWTTRAHLAKCRLLEHLSKYFNSSVHQSDAQRDIAVSYALHMLQCDAKIMNSPLTRGFQWLIHFHFPFPAYMQVVQGLRRRPVGEQADHAWEVMSDSYEVRFCSVSRYDTPFFKIFSKIILLAWEAREEAFRQLGEPLIPPRIVSSIRYTLARLAQNSHNAEMEQANNILGMEISDFPMSMPMGFGGSNLQSLLPDGQVMAQGAHPYIPGQAELNVDFNQLAWAEMDWSVVNALAAGSTGPMTPY